jgi:hypothetical protein
VARPILVDPRGGPLEVAGSIFQPQGAALKVDVWRQVRHPPPELVLAFSVKGLTDEPRAWYVVGPAGALVGKLVSWVWPCAVPEGAGVDFRMWHVRLDVRQDGLSLPGYPVEYSGPLPPGQPLSQLKVSERVEARLR